MAVRLKKGYVISAAVIILAAVFLVLRGARSIPVASAVLKAQDAEETVLATGRVIGEKTIPLSFVRPGRIAVELIKDGDRVRDGQLLMNQDIAREEALLAQRNAALAAARLNLEKLGTIDLNEADQRVRQARANAAYAEDFLQRQGDLFKQNAISKLQYDQALREREVAAAALEGAVNQQTALRTTLRSLAENQVRQAEIEVRQSEIDLREAFLRAPSDGQIVEHLAHKGEFVQGGQKVILFIPSAPRTFVEIQVEEANSGRLRLGQKASVTSTAFPGRVFAATIDRTAPIVDAQRGTFAVRLGLDSYVPELLPESSVSIQIVTGEARGVLLIEQRFLVQAGSRAFVFVADGTRARRRPVVVRPLGNGMFGIESGLKAGDAVLPPAGLKDGSKIRSVAVGA